MRKQVIFLLLLMMCTIQQVYAQERNAQGAGGEFAYEDCGCGYSINLTIFNGLNDQGNPGMYGGDEVADDKEEMPGAVYRV